MSVLPYNDLISRNKGIFSQETQRLIKDCNIAIIGCGLGSVIAELAVKTGFQNISLVDGDIVSINNLNRQIFDINDIGKNKANAAARKLFKINPNLNLQVYDYYLDRNNCRKIVDGAELIIDTIDIAALPIILYMHHEIFNQQKNILFPINLGWGASLIFFNKNSVKLEEMMGLKDDKDNLSFQEIIMCWSNLLSTIGKQGYIKDLISSFVSKAATQGWCPAPQIGLAANLNASLTIGAAIKLITGEPLNSAPNVYNIDVHDVLLTWERK